MAGLTEATRRVAGAIIDHFNKRTAQCDPGIERLAAMLGISRPSVIRATNQLHGLGLIEKTSHGGKANRAGYRPVWERFRAVVQDWDARMKTGDAPGAGRQTVAETAPVPKPEKVSRVIPSRYHPCDVEGISGDTQTLRSNQSNKPVEPERVETRAVNPPSLYPERGSKGLSRVSKPQAQRSMLLPISGGRNVSHAEAARTAAERRLNSDLMAFGPEGYVDAVGRMTDQISEDATLAEMRRRGAGAMFVRSALMAAGRSMVVHA